MKREKIEQITLIIALTFMVLAVGCSTYVYIYNNYIYENLTIDYSLNITLENNTEARPYINLTPGFNTTIKKINLPN